MRIALIPCLLLAFSALLTPRVSAQSAEEKAAFSKIVASAHSMQTMVADFTETRHLEMLSDDVVSSGKLWYKSPSYMRWEYNGRNYGVYSPKGAYMIRDGHRDGALSRGFSQTGKMVTSLMSSLSENLKDYKISYSKEGKELSITAIPTSQRMKAMIESIVMKFDIATSAISSFRINSPSGYTVITFKSVKTNVEVDGQLFN